MSDEDIAVDGAEAALPDEPVKEPEQAEVQQEPATAEVEPEPEPKRKHDGGFQRRINQLTWEKRELERRLAEREQPAQQPQMLDTDDPVAVVRHLAQQEARALVESERRAEFERRQQEQFREVQTRYQQAAQAFSELNPDFWEAVHSLDAAVDFRPEIVEVIGSSELGPQVTYYLAQNVDEAARIASLPPHLAAASIARIESKLSAPRQPKPTNTPSPPPVLGASAVGRKDPAKMTYAEYKAYRMKSNT